MPARDKGARSRWGAQGLRFECTGCGACCVNHGDSTTVFVTLSDRRALARHLGLATQVFTRTWCRKVEGRWALIDAPDGKACVFLKDGKGCSAYAARPTQCRTWPFWPELLESRAWKRDVERCCPGAGKGRLYPRDEIDRIAEEQRRADEES